MKVLVVGGGGREHAIIKKLKENPAVTDRLCPPGNGGIAADAVCVDVNATDIPGLVAFAKENTGGLRRGGAGRPPGPGRGGRPDTGGHPLLRPRRQGRADRGQQGLLPRT